MANYSLGEAILGTGVDLKGLDRGMRQAEGQSKSAWDRVGNIAENALGFLTGAVMTKGFDAIIGLGRDLGDTLLNEAPRVEQLQVSFENLAESAGQSADVVLASMREAANGMVTDVGLMESYNSAMLLVGESMADKFPELLKIAQASAAATGEDVGFLLDSLVKGIGRGSPMILDNLGLTINLSEAYASFAETLGITTEEMTKAQQQEALLNAVVASGGEFIERLGDNTGGTAATLAQLKTTVENLKMGLAMALLPALQAILEPLGLLLTEYGPQIAVFGEMAAQWLGENIPVAIETLQRIFTQFFQNEGPGILDTLKGVVNTVMPFIQEQIATVTAWIQANLPLIIETSQTLVDFWQNCLLPATDNVWNIINLIVSTAVDTILSVITLAMQIITGDWEGAWQTVLDIGTGIWEAIKAIFLEFLEGVLNCTGTSLEEFVAVWKSNFEQAQEIVNTILVQIIGGVIEKVGRFKEIGAQLIEGLRDGIKNAAQSVINAAKNVVQGAIDAAKDVLGIQSPSAIFSDIAAMTWTGFIDETAAMGRDVALSVQHTMNAAPVAAMAAAGAGNGGGGVTLHVHLEHVEIHDDRDVEDLIEQISERLGAALEGRLRPLRGVV